MRKLPFILALAMAAFAVPASASADVFTHEGEPIPENVEITVSFTGTKEDVISAAPTEGVHCATVHTAMVVVRGGGLADQYLPTNCRTKSAEPAKNNLPVDPQAVNLANWTVEPDAVNSRILITGVHINNKVTHPLTTHLVLSESTFKGGTVIMSIPSGQTSAIETVTLSDSGATLEVGLPPAPPALEANISGHLTSNGTIGIAEGE